MQKPTVCIGQGDDEVLDAHRLNIKSALSASLLLLTMNQDLNKIRQKQSTIPISQIFSAIAQISYTGDFRMSLGAEDKNKVSKLVHSPGQYNRWVEMYTPPLLDLLSQGILDVTKRSDGHVIMVECDLQDLSVRRELIKHLPKGLQQKLEPSVDKGSGMSGAILSSELVKIVSNASRVQGVKGLLTAGVSKSIKYAVAKFSKGMLRK
jgi:translocator assembly and maintenance protein 41